MRPSLRVQRYAAVAIASFALLFFWWQTAIFTFRVPESGAAVRASGSAYTIVAVQKGSPAARAGLRAGDIAPSDASGIGGGDVLFSGDPQPPQRLQSVALGITRDGRAHNVTVRPDSTPFPWLDRVRVTARLLSYTVFLVLGTWILVLRPNLMTWFLFAFCAGNIAPTGDLRGVIDVTFGQTSLPDSVLTGIDMAFVRLPISLLPLIALRFPNNTGPGWRGALFRPLVFLLLLYAVATWIAAVFFWSEAIDDVIGWIDIGLNIAAMSILAVSYAQSRGIERQRLKWGVTGVAIGIAAGSADEFARVVSHHSELGIDIGAAFTVVAVLMPVCLAYAIVHHEIIDVRFVFNRTAVLFILFAAFGGVFVALDWLFTYYVTESRPETAIAMVAAFAMGFAFRAYRGALVAAVDRVLFPRHHSRMMLLRELRLTLEQEQDAQQVHRILTEGALQALNLGSAAMFAQTDDGGFVRQSAIGWPPATVWHLFPGDAVVRMLYAHRAKPLRMPPDLWADLIVPVQNAKPALLVPIVIRKRVQAFVLYGAHSDSSDIDPDEARALAQLCALAGEVLAQAYVSALPQPAAAAVRMPQ